MEDRVMRDIMRYLRFLLEHKKLWNDLIYTH